MNRPREHNFLAGFLLVLCFLLACAVMDDESQRAEEARHFECEGQ